MTYRQILFAGAVLALAATPSLMFGRPDAPAMSPHSGDFTFVSLESASEGVPESPAVPVPHEAVPETSAEKSGSLPAKEGMRLRLNADPGNVHIFTDGDSQVSYRVRIEADAREPGADKLVRQFTVTAKRTSSGILLDGKLAWKAFHGPFGVSYEIHIPRRFDVTVHTLGGNIELQDIDGQVDLFTEGGNITVGHVDMGNPSSRSSTSQLRRQTGRIAAKLTTMGGHISVGDISGTLQASTSGGHITAGNVSGDALLRTGGGQIRAGWISGVATIDTGGGNITARLNDGSSQGGIAEQDRGKTSATNSKNSVGNDSEKDAEKESSGFRAMRAASQFTSSEGDVVIYLPRQMSATIDAVIEQGYGHRILADPSLPQKTICQDFGADAVRCTGDVNGGGEVLHLKALAGNIILKVGDPHAELSEAAPTNRTEPGAHIPVFEPMDSSSTSASFSTPDEGADYNEAEGFFAEVRRRILESWWGGLPIDAAEMQKHIEHSVAPIYPDVARKAGVEGDVILRVLVSAEGRVTDLKVLDGPPILARAAVEAVQQWQYRAFKMNGRPIAAVTTMIVSFRLQ